MSDAPTLAALVDEVTAIVKERNYLREQVEELGQVVQRQKSQLDQVSGTFGQLLFGKRTTGPTRVNRKKLTRSEVNEIRDLKRRGESNRSIAEIFDINPATVSRIVRGIYHR